MSSVRPVPPVRCVPVARGIPARSHWPARRPTVPWPVGARDCRQTSKEGGKRETAGDQPRQPVGGTVGQAHTRAVVGGAGFGNWTIVRFPSLLRKRAN